MSKKCLIAETQEEQSKTERDFKTTLQPKVPQKQYISTEIFAKNNTQEKKHDIYSDISTYDTEIVSNSDNMSSMLTSVVSVVNVDELDEKINTMMDKGEGGWNCKACGKQFSKKDNLRQHIEANHIEGASHYCGQCGKVSRSRHALAKHIYVFHKL